MSLSKFNENVNNVQGLADQPAQSADALKRVFDQAGRDIKEYLNEILTEEMDAIESDLRRKIDKNTQDIETNQGNLFNLIYPIGSIYMAVNNTNPSELFGGTWVSWGAGRVPVGVNVSETEFATVEKTGGEKTHKLTVAQIPSHTHTFTGTAHRHRPGDSARSFLCSNVGISTNSTARAYPSAQSGGQHYVYVSDENYSSSGTIERSQYTENITAGGTNSNTGGSGAHNNLQPYITCYMWKRTA